MRHAVSDRRRRDRLSIRRPRRCAPQGERFGHHARAAAVGVHHVQRRLAPLRDGKGDALPVGRDLRAADDSRVRRAPQLGRRFVDELPDAVARALRRDIQEIARAQSRREPASGRQGDGRRCRCVDRRVGDRQPPEGSARIRERGDEAPAVGARRQRGVAVRVPHRHGAARDARHPDCAATAPSRRCRWQDTAGSDRSARRDGSRERCDG